MSTAEYQKQKSDVHRLAIEIKAMGATIMDPMNDLLDAESPEKMAIYDAKGSYYSDNSHLSRHGSMRLQSMIRRWLEENPFPDVPMP